MFIRLNYNKYEKYRKRIKLGHRLVDDFFEKHARCCMCGKDFLCSKMVHFSVSSRHNGRKFNPKSLPNTHITDTQAVEEYYALRKYENLFRKAKFWTSGYITADEWLISHNEKEILKKSEILEYPTLYFHVPQYINRISPPTHPSQNIAEQKLYNLYIAQCKNYVIRNLPFRKTDRFYCVSCANKRYQKAQELVEAFQKLYPTLESITYLENKKTIEKAGEEGERLVEYELGWLTSEFISLRKNFPHKLFIANPNFRNGEKQEYDHLLISPYGIFAIETKNWGGKIIIDESRQWMQIKNGKKIGLVSPCSQAERHWLLLRSILPLDAPVYSIICIANKNVIIEGMSYSEFPVIKYDRIRSFINKCSQTSKRLLTPEKIFEIVALLKKHRL